jgi:serine/threonine-protein kinase
MALIAGTRLGPYEIVGPLGAGGMGEVYRAHDIRLDRDVAIKALPDAFSSDPDRLSRFEREAKVLASLNHPNVAGIYGVEDAGGHRYLALEYVEGETLAARLTRGALPLEEAIEICLQIATGMEAAHESGIVHRDLKPGNVMITPSDQVKVVDFGLAKGKVAKAMSPESPTMTESPALHHSPTMGTPATLPGVILGTAAYLSPEQARGKAVDRRTDIWSFGCVLYECLTGRRAFEGETVSDLVAAILKGDVDWSRLPRGTPTRLRELIQQCLERDPRQRHRDIGDARLALAAIRDGRGGEPAGSASRSRSARTVAGATLVGLVGVFLGISVGHLLAPGGLAAPKSRHVVRSTIDVPLEAQENEGGISPDGRYLIVPGRPVGGGEEHASARRLYRRRTDSYRFEEVAGSEGFRAFGFGPEGRWIYFTKPAVGRSTDLRLMKAPLDGSGASASASLWDPSWDPTRWIPLASGDVLACTLGGDAYVRVPAGGGAPKPQVKFELSGLRGTCWLWNALPGDRGALLNIEYYDMGRLQMGTGCVDLKKGTTKLLLRDGINAVYVSPGYLVFLRQSTLFAVPFELNTLETRGEPVAIGEGVLEMSRFCVSNDGTLTYRYGGAFARPRRLAVADRQGRVSDWTPERMAFDNFPVASPKGNRAAIQVLNTKMLDEIWILERASASGRRAIAMDGASCIWPVWSPDERKIAFYRRASDKEDGIYVQDVDGGEPRRITRSDGSSLALPTSWSPDGKHLLATVFGKTGDWYATDVVRVETDDLADTVSAPRPLFSGLAKHGMAYFSPDGRWVAYHSNETGESQVYAAPYHLDGSLGSPLTLGRGVNPAWSRSSRQVFFNQGDDVAPHARMAYVSLSPTSPPSASPPTPCWDLESLRMWGGWDILPGDQFLFVQKGEDESTMESMRIACVTNFFDELRSRVREGKN